MRQEQKHFPIARKPEALLFRRYAHGHRQWGYALLMTLLLLLLAGTAMAAACRISLRQALTASAAQRSLTE